MDKVIYIYVDKVEDLISDTMKKDEAITDEIIKTERDKINNEETSALEEDKSDSENEEDNNVPIKYANNGGPKRKTKKPQKYKPIFSGRNYE